LRKNLGKDRERKDLNLIMEVLVIAKPRHNKRGVGGTMLCASTPEEIRFLVAGLEKKTILRRRAAGSSKEEGGYAICGESNGHQRYGKGEQ